MRGGNNDDNDDAAQAGSICFEKRATVFDTVHVSDIESIAIRPIKMHGIVVFFLAEWLRKMIRRISIVIIVII